SNAGTMKQSHWLGLLLSLEGSVDHLILKNGYFVTMHMLSRSRLCTMFGHRHHMRKCTRHNELQCNKNDEDPTEHTVSFRPSRINTSQRSVVKSEEALQLLEAHDYVGSGVLISLSAICASPTSTLEDVAGAANGGKVRTPAFGASRSERRLSPHASFLLKARMRCIAKNPTKHR
ncbi:hypothetical protein, partial [Thioclava sp. SK-1]|uniref:hypothetical protein n=1 Tax=Thioclava sp. SK-1 TaxID=1889770 RepID=UPI001C4009BE